MQVLTINAYVDLHCTRCQTTTQPRLESTFMLSLVYNDQVDLLRFQELPEADIQ